MTTGRVTIRPARRSDVPAIVGCANGSTLLGEETGFATPLDQRTFTDEGRLASVWRDPDHAGDAEVLVAEVDGSVVGYVTFEDRRSELELVNVDVLRDHQRQGIGGRLVHAVEARARAERKTAVTLGTSRNAEGTPWKSFAWWTRQGFEVVGEEENSWTRSIGPGVREIRLRKPLSHSERA